MSFGQDGSATGIYAQRYNAAGVAQGSEFRVNTYTTGDQTRPRATWMPQGGFVVAWQSMGQDGSDDGVFGQRYDASGVPQGGEFRVNGFTPGVEAHAAIASAQNRFAVAWQGGGEGSGYGVFLRRFSVLSGDVNGDGVVNVSDVFYLINYLFAAGPAPVGPGDVDASGAVNVTDVFYLIDYLFAGGPAPK
jgi:hypothetical protein